MMAGYLLARAGVDVAVAGSVVVYGMTSMLWGRVPLFDKVSWLRRNDEMAEAIGRRGQQLAQRLSYESELDRSVPVISAAVRYFGGRAGAVGPYGRVVN